MTLNEIDKRLDLLKEYIKYRTEWLVKYEGYHNANFYYADKCGIVFISPFRSDEDYYHTRYEMGINIILSSSPNILSFEEFVEKFNNVLLKPNPFLNFLKKNIHTRNEEYETFLHKIEKLGLSTTRLDK